MRLSLFSFIRLHKGIGLAELITASIYSLKRVLQILDSVDYSAVYLKLLLLSLFLAQAYQLGFWSSMLVEILWETHIFLLPYWLDRFTSLGSLHDLAYFALRVVILNRHHRNMRNKFTSPHSPVELLPRVLLRFQHEPIQRVVSECFVKA